MMNDRPIGVTLLAVVAGVSAVLAGVATLRFLGFLPFLGPVDGRIFSLWYALLYGLLTYVWVWVAQMLWRVEYEGWLFGTHNCVQSDTQFHSLDFRGCLGRRSGFDGVEHVDPDLYHAARDAESF